jgi:hypothetical protein
MRVKTHLIVTDQYEDYKVKWCGRLLDADPKLKNGLPIFIITTNSGRMELNTLDLVEVERQAKKFTYPRGRGSITTDKGFIYIKENNGNEKLLGVVIHNHIRKYAPMYDEL